MADLNGMLEAKVVGRAHGPWCFSVLLYVETDARAKDQSSRNRSTGRYEVCQESNS
jgi:hypothetical protein